LAPGPRATNLFGMEPTVQDQGLTTQVISARRIARQTILGFSLCEGSGSPLSERQKISVLTAMLLEFDGFQAEVESVLEIDRLLAQLEPDDRL
jgi:hypothetical protein